MELPGSTVDDVIAAAVERFGSTFESGLARSRVWLNGEEASGADAVSEGDEVALIPPVSGGSDVATVPAGVSQSAIALVLIGVTVIAANVFGSEAWVAATIVGAIAIWAGDVASTVAVRGRDLPVVPVLLTVVAAVVGTRLVGGGGMAIAAAVAMIAPMVWGVISETSRLLTIIAPAILVSLQAGLATASLLEVRFSRTATEFGVFLVVAVAATAAGALTERLRSLPFGDPFTISAITAIAAAIVAAAIWDLELATYLFVGVVLAVGLVAGRTLGSIVRTGSTSLVEKPPGIAYAMDGVIVAAMLYLPILALLS